MPHSDGRESSQVPAPARRDPAQAARRPSARPDAGRAGGRRNPGPAARAGTDRVCTAIAPDAVFTVRTYGTGPLYGPGLDPGGLLTARRSMSSIRSVTVAMMLLRPLLFLPVVAAEWACHVDAACPVA